MNSGRLAVRAIARNVAPRRNYGGGHHHRSPTMNDLPVPQGDFFHHHHEVNKTHKQVLAVGIFMLSTALYIVKESKIINFNWSPPDTYE